jgi:hypothetical protein
MFIYFDRTHFYTNNFEILLQLCVVITHLLTGNVLLTTKQQFIPLKSRIYLRYGSEVRTLKVQLVHMSC